MIRDYRRPDEVTNPLLQEEEPIRWDGVHILPTKIENGVPELIAADDDTDSDSDSDEEPQSAIPENVVSIDLNKYPFVMMQMESGYKTHGRVPDIVIADEPESDTAQFSSPTMKQVKKCSDNFQKNCQEAKWLIAMDAFMCDKTLEMASEFGIGKQVRYRHNTWLPEGNKAYSVEGKSSGELKDNMAKGIIASLKANKRAVLFTSNNQIWYSCSEIGSRHVPGQDSPAVQ